MGAGLSTVRKVSILCHEVGLTWKQEEVMEEGRVTGEVLVALGVPATIAGIVAFWVVLMKIIESNKG